jgi:CheY-like chemotaxis protein
VFEPFSQADAGTTRQHGGLGLGLSIVKHLVHAHGGTVSVASDGEGRGATFTVRLPLAAHSSARAAEAACDTAAPPHESLADITVLVVDDDEESRAVLQAQLENHHASVLTAASAADARALVRNAHVDIILTDVAMPGEDGYSFVRWLRADAVPRMRSIPAIAVTAFARAEDRQRALDAGFQAHLPKPIETRAVIAAIATLCRHDRT